MLASHKCTWSSGQLDITTFGPKYNTFTKFEVIQILKVKSNYFENKKNYKQVLTKKL